MVDEEVKCFICKKMYIKGDVTSKKVCKLCGMGIFRKSKVIRIGNHLFDFCCSKCLKIFKVTRFNLKRKYKDSYYATMIL